MKAAVYHRYGGPEVLEYTDMDMPSPDPDEVLIRVRASSVNRTDTGFRSAEYFISRLFSGLFRPRTKVLGCEFSGDIVAKGANITEFEIGERVFGYDDHRFGGHAQYKVAKAKAIAPIPSGWTFEEAAALTEGSHYAWYNIRAAQVKAGDRVLVYGATGAIGSAAVQILKFLDAYVVAVANSKNIHLVKALGADEVVDYQTEDFTQTEHQFDYVFDAVGKISFGQCKALLKPRGIYSSTELGKNSENIGLALITPLQRGKKVIFPIPLMKKEDLLFLANLAAQGHFRPVIDRKFPLSEIVAAHRYVETGQKTGNVILDVDN